MWSTVHICVQQVSEEAITLILAVTMAGYVDISDFQRGLIVDAREMGRNSEVAWNSLTISRAYRRYQVSGKTSNLRQEVAGKRT
ncbi:hypothetical protein TNCV_502851 [Trichonephila clavipes]|nr:hypothetical protein TNCV_502851 [Trichonephila clavipes]